MNKDEFLSSRTRDAIEVYDKHKRYTTTFAILFEDGTSTSFATQFEGEQSKEIFEFFMRKKSSDPQVIACTLTSESWASIKAKKENKRPSECDDREAVVTLLYSTRDKMQEMQIYKPNKNGKLECIYVTHEHQGRFTNPFLVPCLTITEKEKVIDTFQQTVRDSICQTYEQFHEMQNFLFILTDISGEVGIQHLTDEEWQNKNWLKQMIRSKCREPYTIAFILAYPENDMVNVILVSEKRQELFCYGIDPLASTMKLESREPYKGEFSGFVKGPEIVFLRSRQDESYQRSQVS